MSYPVRNGRVTHLTDSEDYLTDPAKTARTLCGKVLTEPYPGYTVTCRECKRKVRAPEHRQSTERHGATLTNEPARR